MGDNSTINSTPAIPGIHTLGFVEFVVGENADVLIGQKCYLLVKSPVLKDAIIRGEKMFLHPEIEVPTFAVFLDVILSF